MMFTRLIMLVVFVATAPHVKATIIEISGAVDSSNNGLWEITTISGVYSDVSSTLKSQVWWENGDLASLFVITLADSLGFPNANGIRGPAFNVTEVGSLLGGSPRVQGWWWREAGLRSYRAGTNANLTWAIATPVEVPEPSTLAILVLGLLGLGFNRKQSLPHG